mmetsp:Transcript_644/g.865  ORF Transcript_644/g.865 Transcript_644/m.865 type:complete len:254 (+) Transcript_644:30-791(+)
MSQPQPFTYVLVPSDNALPFKELSITPKKDKEVESLPQALQAYFAKNAKPMSAVEKQELRKQIESQAKQPIQLTDDILEMMASSSIVDIVPLYPNRPQSDFVGVSIYCDDKGMIKNLPVNERASAITMLCGKPTRVYGDCFFARVKDDGRDVFERMDFTLKDLQSGTGWMKEAKEFNESQEGQKAAANSMLSMQPQAGAVRDKPGLLCCNVPGCTVMKKDMSRCGGCKKVHYCSKEHQKKDWKKHKTTCKAST